MLDDLMKCSQQVVEKPSSLYTIAKWQTLEAAKSKEHLLYCHFIDLSNAAKIDKNSNSREDKTTTSSSLDDVSDDVKDNRKISPFWLAVLFKDVQIEVHNDNFVRQQVACQWLNQTSGPLTYTPGKVCNENSPNCILT